MKGERIKTIENFLRTEIEGGTRAADVVHDILALRAVGIRWNPRLRTCAGRVKMDRHTRRPTIVELNPRLRSNPGELTDTVLHEVAHAVAMARGTDDGHGSMWRATCRELGQAKPSTYHHHESVPRRKCQPKKIVAVCFNCSTDTRRARYLDQRSVYRCRRCGETVLTDRRKLDPLNAGEPL